MGNKLEKPAPMFCILLNDGFLICEEKKSKNKEIQYLVKEDILLDSALEVFPLQDSKIPFAFRIRSFSIKKTCIAPSDAERSEWTSSFIKALVDVAEQENTLTFSSYL